MAQRRAIIIGLTSIAFATAILVGRAQVSPLAQASAPVASPNPLALAVSGGSLPDELGTLGTLIPAGPYLYVSYETPAGDQRWAVTLKGEITPGEVKQVIRYGAIDGFESRRLERRFDRLYFVRFKDPSPQTEAIP